MEGIGVKELSQIKLAVKAKLTELGAFVDEELPDYILVMISNRRSKAQMKNDLSLFLGCHTDAFTEWLHVVLQRLEAFATTNISEKVKLDKTTNQKSKTDSTSDTHLKHSEKTHQRDRKHSTSSKEKDDSEITSREKGPVSRTETAGNSEVYKPTVILSQTSVKTKRSQIVESMEEDCIHISDEHDQEFKNGNNSRSHYLASNKDSKKRRLGHSGEQAFKKIRYDSDSNNRRDRLEVNDKLDDSHQRTSLGQVKRPRIGSVVKPVASFNQNVPKTTERDKHASKTVTNDAVDQNGVPSTVQITPRPRRPAKLQATKSLVLKAVAEAQKSVAANPPRMETERKSPLALFTRKYREGNSNSNVNAGTSNLIEKTVSMEEKSVETSQSPISTSIMEIDNSVSPSPVETVETRFIVTLDGVHMNVPDQLEPEEEEEGFPERKMGDTKATNVKSRLFRRRSTGSDIGAPQTLERCKYWPACRQGEKCSYHHPSLPCRTFPKCSYGDGCLFIHPNCKFDSSCTRKNCPFTHNANRSAKPALFPPVTTGKVQTTTNKNVCKFFPLCNNVSCQFYHPLACKFGNSCTRSGCSFYHAPKSTPPLDKLKWVANK